MTYIMKKGILIAAVAAVAGALSAWIVTKAAGSDQTAQQVMVATDGGQYRTVNLSLDDYPDFTYAAESAVDAVVYVKVVSREAVRNPQSIFDFFFGYGATPQERERVGSGSGVIIREDGYIVTNNHVIEGATEIEVTLTNNKTFKAELIGADPATDVALIKVDAQGLPTIPFGDSDRLRLGEWVLVGGQDEIASLQQSWSAGTYFPLSDYISQTPAAGELREVSCLSLMINTGRYTDVLAGYFKDPYSEAVRRAFGKRNFEFLTVNMGKIGNELGIKASLYREDLMSLPQPSGVEEGNVVVEDIPVPVPEGPFRVKNFIDGSTNWLEQLENNDLRLLGASRNPVWTVKFSTPVCGTVRQIDYLKNDKLQMLFGSEDKIYLLDRLGRKVGRFPIS